MSKYKVLFVAQEIVPYLSDSPMGRFAGTFRREFRKKEEKSGHLCLVLAVSMKGATSFTKWSAFQVWILSLTTPTTLIIKVASIQSARLQVYFIDNEDYFQRKAIFTDKSGEFFGDNDERAIFYARGVIETVKKLGWSPDIIHVHGWFSSMVPFFIKTAFKNNPLFSDTKIVCSIYDDDFKKCFNKESIKKLKHEGVTDKDIKQYKSLDFVGMMKAAIDFSDGIIQGSEKVNPEILAYAKKSNKPMLTYQPKDKYINAYSVFYDELVDELINEDAVK